MSTIERRRTALRGGVVDHPPVTVWYPFGLQHAPAEEMAAATAPISGVTSRRGGADDQAARVLTVQGHRRQ